LTPVISGQLSNETPLLCPGKQGLSGKFDMGR
jgi:hypothetical protein